MKFAGTPILEVRHQLEVSVSGAQYSTNDSQHHVILSCGPISPQWVDTLNIVWIVSTFSQYETSVESYNNLIYSFIIDSLY